MLRILDLFRTLTRALLHLLELPHTFLKIGISLVDCFEHGLEFVVVLAHLELHRVQGPVDKLGAGQINMGLLILLLSR